MVWFVRTYVVMLVLGEHGEPLPEELDKLLGHLVELVQVCIGVDITETGSNGVVDEEQVRELVPGAVIVGEGVLILDSVGANLHQGTVFGTAAGAAVQPDDGALPVCDVLVLEVPEEEVSVVFGGDFNVAVMKRASAGIASPSGETEASGEIMCLPCVHLDEWLFRGAGQIVNEVVGLALGEHRCGP